jgi:glutathione S-transferase
MLNHMVKGISNATAVRPREESKGGANGTPVLWHLKVSYYNEKARWALDFKGVVYRLRGAPPGLHPLWAWRLGGGRTFPLLVIDGEAIGDSSLIVEALEQRRPDPPLYPGDPAERSRIVRRYYDVNPASLERARQRIRAALVRFRAELQPSGYLVGERFSVADLT